ncbi:ABC-type nitrate/sulfonate/bicarbonate transport system, substrate-binding protein [Thermomonospora echinospora]|uniref:ABC-type nitrate/sulfonate/bicarbonate transport system, substrate-binding protein n=1 Tax=Thermomonospora echinospora TaxID=1992 RepID=A0A1H6B209_9ACTN|nr:ABC transporter substrate-binding protein [Thermomonospora echinospora]SEG54257.1 ABC-type nitrate/sulfonate/bicarbonate transport system, substrate-binding protein [Thermomonospora echinospora]
MGRYACCPAPTVTAVAARAGFLAAEFGPDGPPVPTPRDPVPWGPGGHPGPGTAGLIQESGNVPALRARAHGAPTRLVAISWADEYQAVLARPDSGIGGPADLAGRTVGVPGSPGRRAGLAGVTALRGFDRALRLAGLGLDDVRVRTLPDRTGDGLGVEDEPGVDDHGPAAAALADGTVDAIWVRGTAGLAVRRALRAVEVAALGDHPDPFIRVNNGTPRALTVHAALLADQPELVARHLAALLRAARWTRAGGAEVAQVMAAETGDPAYVHRPRTDFAPDLTGEHLAVLAAQSAFLELHGFINAHVDLGCWTDPRPLQRAWELAADPFPMPDRCRTGT